MIKIVPIMINPQIQILLATYNGELFLQEQLDSIAHQSYKNWTILARDDESTDSTCEILKEFQQKNPDKLILVEDGCGKSGDAATNFLKLLKHSTADIVALADQDDIWHPHKVERSVAALSRMQLQHGVHVPAMVHHDFSLVDADKSMLVKSFDRAQSRRRELNHIVPMPFSGCAHGFSMIFNRALIEKTIPAPSMIGGHDALLACVAHDFGRVEFISEQLALYRRHGKNVSAGESYQRRALGRVFSEGISFTNVATTIREIFRDAHDNLKNKCEITSEYLDRYGDEMSPKRRDLLVRFAHIEELGMVARKSLLFRHVAESPRTRILASLML
ncbi:MAG: glycosyltransferase family 2 protein [Pseudomonadota bacterium]